MAVDYGWCREPAPAALRADLRMRARCRRPRRELPPLSARTRAGRWSGRSLRPAGADRRPRGGPPVRPRPVPGVGDTPSSWCCAATRTMPTSPWPPSTGCCSRVGSARTCASCTGSRKDGVNPGSYAELAIRDALDLTDQTVTEPVTGELVAGTIEVKRGTIVPGPTRQDVSYLSDPAIGGVRFGFPTLGSRSACPWSGSGPIASRCGWWWRPATSRPRSHRTPRPTCGCRCRRPRSCPSTRASPSTTSFLDDFALWQRFSPEEQAEMASIVGGGAHWMFTPSRPLTLVHAVRRPMTDPAVLEVRRADPGARIVGSRAGRHAVGARQEHRTGDADGGWTDTGRRPG